MERRNTLVALIVVVLALASGFLVGCGSDPTPANPTLTVVAKTLGAVLGLDWDDVPDADEYRVYIDNALWNTFTTSAADIDSASRGSLVEVSASGKGGESGRAQKNLTLAETTNLIVWSAQDPDTTHPSFVRFNADGTAAAVTCSQSNTAHFFVDGTAGNLQFRSIQNATVCGVNANVDPFFNDTGTTNYSGSTLAPGPGVYNDPQNLVDQGVYYIWVDLAPFGTWGTNDFYAKLKVNAVAGLQTTLQIGYQKEGGLRWLK